VLRIAGKMMQRGKKVKQILYLFFIVSSLAWSTTVTVDNNESEHIADNTCFNKTFAVTEDITVSRVRLDVNITHTWRGDLELTLTSPAGTSVDVTSDNGGSADNLYVYFRDDAAESITDDSQTHTTMVERRPEESFDTFYDENASGTWTLQICDDAGGDTGTFHNAALHIDSFPLGEGLQVDFRMDECYWLGGANGVDDDVKDSSGNGLDAQSRNKANNTQTNAKICRAGDFVNTYSDPNKSDAVFYPNETIPETDVGKNAPFSVSAWLYRHDNDKWMAAVIKVSDESWADGWGLEHANGAGNTINFFVGGYQNYAQASLATDTWTHIVATYDGSTIRLYKNGTLVATKSQSSYTPGSHAVVIGDDVSGNSIDDRWQGIVDEVKIFGRVLSGSEVKKIYDDESAGKNYDGSDRVCKPCNGSSISANSWDLIGIPVDDRTQTVTVGDVFGDDMNGTYGSDWMVYKRTYSTTDNSSDYQQLAIDDALEFGAGYWLGSKLDNEWYVDGLPNVDYNSTDSACTAAQCVEIDLTPVTHNFEEDGNDGTGPYRYNMSGFIGLTKPVNWADCRFVIDGTAYTPTDANNSGYASKQIWLYNGTGTGASDSYITCDDTMDCKLVPFKGFWVELHGPTKGKSVKLLIPKEE